jgi:NAD(P)-dependent dehydrogenase (short-subunit alcohol dehydrogenase family)
LKGATALVLAATGPVGQRIVRLLARERANVRVASRSVERAEAVCRSIAAIIPDTSLTPISSAWPDFVAEAMEAVDIVFSAGAAGIQLLPSHGWELCEGLRVAIDLNAVPPLGIEGIEVSDKAVDRNGVICYGAIGVGGSKMKIHKAAIRQLFTANDQVLDAEEIFAIGRQLAAQSGE